MIETTTPPSVPNSSNFCLLLKSSPPTPDAYCLAIGKQLSDKIVEKKVTQASLSCCHLPTEKVYRSNNKHPIPPIRLNRLGKRKKVNREFSNPTQGQAPTSSHCLGGTECQGNVANRLPPMNSGVNLNFPRPSRLLKLPLCHNRNR